MERSESIAKLTQALCKFHTQIETISKTALVDMRLNNGTRKRYKYANLQNILDVISGPLAENELNICCFPTGKHELETILSHVSGEFIASTYTMEPVKNAPQDLGSVITYQRRYAIVSILNLNIGDDDDDATKATYPEAVIGKDYTITETRKPAPKPFKDEYLCDKFFQWIYNEEQRSKKNGVFDMAAFVRTGYAADDSTMEKIYSSYGNYKVNNNLL